MTGFVTGSSLVLATDAVDEAEEILRSGGAA